MTDFGRIGQAQWFAVSTPFHFGAPQFSSRGDRLHGHRDAGDHDRDDRGHPRHRRGRRPARPTARPSSPACGPTACPPRCPAACSTPSRPAPSPRTSGWWRITGIKSRFVVAASGVILVVLGLFPKVGAIVAAIPMPVLGGAGLALFATVAASGIRALGRVNYEGNNNLIIVALSIGMGVIPIAVPTFYEHFPSWFQTVFDSGISSAAVTAVLLNLLFNVGRSGTLGRRRWSPSRRRSGSRRTTTCRAASPTRATPPTTAAARPRPAPSPGRSTDDPVGPTSAEAAAGSPVGEPAAASSSMRLRGCSRHAH